MADAIQEFDKIGSIHRIAPAQALYGSQRFRHGSRLAGSPITLAWNLQENLPLFQLPQPELKVQLAARLGTLAATDKLFIGTSSWKYDDGIDE